MGLRGPRRVGEPIASGDIDPVEDRLQFEDHICIRRPKRHPEAGERFAQGKGVRLADTAVRGAEHGDQVASVPCLPSKGAQCSGIQQPAALAEIGRAHV